jgi:hypothetical protein
MHQINADKGKRNVMMWMGKRSLFGPNAVITVTLMTSQLD